jgi:hypothetical protein
VRADEHLGPGAIDRQLRRQPLSAPLGPQPSTAPLAEPPADHADELGRRLISQVRDRPASIGRPGLFGTARTPVAVAFGAAYDRAMYLSTLALAAIVCGGLAQAIPAWRRPLMVLVLLVLAAAVFTPDLALGVRLFAALCTAVMAVVVVSQLRRA